MPHPRSLPAVHPTERLMGESPAIVALRTQIRHLATFDGLGHPHVPTVLLCGETGTGKGLVARIIHDSGPRAHGSCIEINCAAIPETLLEAELYGVAAGAFTDAKRPKPGLFEAASGGTLFLDEIDALPLALQGKLLTAIEAKRVRRLGAVTEQSVDVKLIAATQMDLSVRAQEGTFRGDLYQRLAVVLLDLPPLRERGDDVVLLAAALLQQYAEAYRLPLKRLSTAAEEWLRSYPWPGNVRELSHLLERVMLLSAEVIIDPDTLERLCLPRLPSEAASAPSRDGRVDEDDATRIAEALRHTGGNVARAARLLGVSRKAVRYRMHKYGIRRLQEDAKSSCPRPPSPGVSVVPSGAMGKGKGGGAEPAAASSPRISRSTRGQDHGKERADRMPSWEQKLVAVLALDLSWPSAVDGEVPHYEPWTATRRREQLIAENMQGLGGVLLQRSPSLLLVAFGLPHTLEQLPQRAVQAALALRQMVATSPAGEFAPKLRQAVHWGQLVVDVAARDPTGSVLTLDDTLTRPVRLLGHTAPGEILVSPAVAALVERWCEMQTCEGPFRPDPSHQVVAFSMVGLRLQRFPLALYAQRPLTRFVGRAWELAVLEDLLEQARAGAGQVVSVVGEPGVGKTRLCYEFTHAHVPHGWRILESSADSYGQATPYLPVIDLLKAFFRLHAGDDRQMMRAKVTDKLLALEPTLQPILPTLLVLLEVAIDDSEWQALDSPQRRQRFMDAVKQLLLRESQVQPLVLVVENLHWIDSETHAFLDHLVEGLPMARVLLLVSYRPEFHHSWVSKTYYAQLRLDPLPPETAKALLQALLGDPGGVDGHVPLQNLAQRLIERTEGNPFFLEESVRTLVETGVLAGESGAYRLVKPLQSLQVPATVQAVLGARIDRLSTEEKRLLQTAAIIGTEVPLPLLQAIADLPEESLRRGLTHLQAAEFLYETHLFPEGAYTFKHALTHEVAYGSLLHERRRALHARIVEAIEAVYADHLAEHVEQLAHHALRGEVWHKAMAYCRQAGVKAGARSAYREAGVCFDRALEAIKHLPESQPTLEQAIDLRCELRTALIPLGEIRRVHDLLLEAEILAKAMVLAQRAIEVAQQYNERGNQAWILRLLGEIAAHRDPPEAQQAEDHYRQALALAEELAMHPLQAHCHLGLGTLYAKMARHEQARTELSTAIALYRTMDMTFWLPQAEATLTQVGG